MDPKNKVALVTGAAKRIGQAIALELAEAGCNLAIHYHTSNEAAIELAGQIEKLGRRTALVPGDLADPLTAQKLIDQTTRALGRLDILVNSASVFEQTPIDQANVTHWERIFRINTIAPAMLIRAAATAMGDAGAGRIVNITDIYADRPMRKHDAYCASKAALVSLTRSLAIELAPQITVNAVAPGIALFPDSYDQTIREKLIARVPLRRAGSPEEVAALVRFLVTSGDYITGQIIPIDGGRSIAY